MPKMADIKSSINIGVKEIDIKTVFFSSRYENPDFVRKYITGAPMTIKLM
ncbi:hypothetical protein CHRYSEO8AT_500042 [Chryseobacterium sp. 8AT]|nr:hypothetical protein CHRYSEO8AT_500042 [Chryseobacterium sp. 8AT]